MIERGPCPERLSMEGVLGPSPVILIELLLLLAGDIMLVARILGLMMTKSEMLLPIKDSFCRKI